MIPPKQLPSEQQSESPSGDNLQPPIIRELVNARTIMAALVICVLGLALIVITFIVPFFHSEPNSLLTQLVQQIGIALFVTGLVSLVAERLINSTRNQLENRVSSFLEKDVKGRLDEIQKQQEEYIKQQTAILIATSASLQAMHGAGISRMYLQRDDAVHNMEQDLAKLSLSRIRLIGISLNDFVRDNGVFHGIWRQIVEYVVGDREPPNSKHLSIEILIIDPTCQGAYLRSKGEQRDSKAVVRSRLVQDLELTRLGLQELERTAQKNQRISFSFRLYRLPPMLFLLSTDTVSYTQPYYFWGSRDPAAPFPLLRFDGEKLHAGLNDHFEWVWNQASISSSEYYENHQVGLDKGLRQSGVINVFDDPALTKKRINALLEGAKKKRLYIQGFSLRSYFDEGELYYKIAAFAKAQKELIDAAPTELRAEMGIKVLIINPNSEQAIYRSYREYRLQNPTSTLPFEKFKAGSYKEAQLYGHTENSVRWLRRLADEYPNVQFKWYDTAPYCFMLMMEDSVLVEQYHYGKVRYSEVRSGVESPVLGKDMAVFEYAYQSEAFGLIQTYRLLESHFNFVFDTCAQEIPPAFGALSHDLNLP